MAKLKMSEKSYSNLISAERKLLDNLPEYDKLDECGADCSALRAMTQEYLDKIAKMKQYYAP